MSYLLEKKLNQHATCNCTFSFRNYHSTYNVPLSDFISRSKCEPTVHSSLAQQAPYLLLSTHSSFDQYAAS